MHHGSDFSSLKTKHVLCVSALSTTQEEEAPPRYLLPCFSFLFCSFLVVLYRKLTIGFGIVNKAEVDVCLELSHFFDDPTDAGNLISGSSAFSEFSLNIWNFMVHLLLDPGMENFEHYFASV